MKRSTKRALAALGLLAIVAWWRGGASNCALGSVPDFGACSGHAQAALPRLAGGIASPSP